MATLWYYVLKGERKGPVEAPEFINLIRSQVISPDDYIWRKGFDNWKKLAEVSDLNTHVSANSGPTITPVSNLASQEEEESNVVDLSAKTGEFKVPTSMSFDWKSAQRDENRFYVLIGKDRGQQETQYGPYSLSLIEKLYKETRINEKTYIWTKGLDNWEMIGEIPYFQNLFNTNGAGVSDLDRRDDARRPFVARMFFHDNSKLYEGICRDISIGGMQVLVPSFPGKIGDQISINVHPDNSDYHFVASGKVVRILEGNMGFSFRFINLAPEAESAIKAYISNENGA